MPRILKQQLHSFLHDYKKQVFQLEHDPAQVEERKATSEQFVGEVLDQKFHYHFHRKVDPERADTLQLIHNYCREALFPPVMTQLAERVLLLEERQALALTLIQQLLDQLAVDSEPQESPSLDGKE